MKKFTKLFVGVFCAVLLATSAFAADKVVKATNAPVAVETVKAAPAPEAWVLTLGGVGNTVTTSGGDTAFGVDLSLGRTGHLLLPLEAGVRQSVSYSDGDTTLNTRLYSDWTLFTVVKKVDVFTGVAVGVQYGNQNPSWELAPEAGVRWWLKKDVAAVARAEFPFAIDDSWKYKDDVRYFLGFAVKF